MTDIHISVKDKIAVKTDKTFYVCGNSDFRILFDFDSEWDAYETKTARFSHDGSYTDIVFDGSECAVPIISDIYCFHVGVYAGDLHTTTPARVPCRKSILCGGGIPADPAPDVYNQLMERINELESPDWNQNDSTAKDYIKNRTHYTTVGDVVMCPKTVAQVSKMYDSGGLFNSRRTDLTVTGCTFIVGATYKLVVNDVAHIVSFEAGAFDPRYEDEKAIFGLNVDPFNGVIRDTSVGAALVFLTAIYDEYDNITPGAIFKRDLLVVVPTPPVDFTVSVEIISDGEIVQPLDDKYIPATIPRVLLVNGTKEWNDENEEYTVTLDKNFEQMLEAQQNGAFVVAKIDKEYYMQMYAGAKKIRLSHTNADDKAMADIIVGNDNLIDYYKIDIPPWEALDMLYDLIPTDEHINDLINQALAGIPDASEVAY